MNDHTVEETDIGSINYRQVVTGKIPEPEIRYELFLSHCTAKDTPQRKLVEEMSGRFEKIYEITTFFDGKDTNTNPVNIINMALDGSRIIIPICTPEYIKKFKEDKNSWPCMELGPFIIWEENQSRDLIIPVLLDISRNEFATKGIGIPTLIIKRSVEIPPEYTTSKDIVELKVKEIVLIYKEYLKQWRPISR